MNKVLLDIYISHTHTHTQNGFIACCGSALVHTHAPALSVKGFHRTYLHGETRRVFGLLHGHTGPHAHFATDWTHTPPLPALPDPLDCLSLSFYAARLVSFSTLSSSFSYLCVTLAESALPFVLTCSTLFLPGSCVLLIPLSCHLLLFFCFSPSLNVSGHP